MIKLIKKHPGEFLILLVLCAAASFLAGVDDAMNSQPERVVHARH